MAKRGAHVSTKRLLISKANTPIVIGVAVAAAVLAFSLVASRSLLQKRAYQSRVIAAQEQARDQLEENVEAVDVLAASYQEFVNRPENIIGGNSQGDGSRDGDNAKIVLDALPGRYDFPALATSLEKILLDRNYDIVSITGTDQPPESGGGDESADPDAESSGDGMAAVPVEMPFELTAQGSYTAMVDLLRVFERSIRPLTVQRATFTAGSDAGANQVQLAIEGLSYYQPQKTLDVRYEVVE